MKSKEKWDFLNVQSNSQIKFKKKSYKFSFKNLIVWLIYWRRMRKTCKIVGIKYKSKYIFNKFFKISTNYYNKHRLNKENIVIHQNR